MAGKERAGAEVLAMRDRALALRRAGRSSEARAVASQALLAVRRGGRSTLEAELLLLIGNCYADDQSYEQAGDALRTAAQLFRRDGRNTEYAQAIISQGRVLAESGEDDAAIDFFKQLVGLPLPSPLRSQVVGNLGVLYRRRGDLGEAIDLLRQDVSICEQSGDEYGAAVARFNLAVALRDAGRNVAADTYARTAAEAFDRLGAIEYAQRAWTLMSPS